MNFSFGQMKNIRFAVSVSFIALMTIFAIKGSSTQLLSEADSAYNAGNYRMALTKYMQVLDNEGSSSELYYNIGNANYRVGNIGKAIVNYERALRLDPSNKDAKANLEYVNSTIKGLPEDGSSFLSNVHGNIRSGLTTNAWAIVALCLFICVLGCMAIYLFSKNANIKKIGFFGGFAVVALFIYSLVIAIQTASEPGKDNTGIVIRNNARLTSSPGTTKQNSDKTIHIPEGSKVNIIDSLATPEDAVTSMWYNVAMGNNTRAWIDSGDVERI